MNELKRAPFSGEFIVKEEVITRPVVTVLRDNNSFGSNEKDLIICGVCGALNNYKKSYCGGCGAKFKRVTLEEAKKINAQIEEQENNELNKNQMNIFDYIKEGATK